MGLIKSQKPVLAVWVGSSKRIPRPAGTKKRRRRSESRVAGNGRQAMLRKSQLGSSTHHILIDSS
ncbi:uncharacterized protein PGTG_02070 [Puccinia graminis f. sp. tritici CRL 75-36-700-3]|uniref:Uncharacterized protein n=1 Tax=Puccinia graminis f. sp. tritici (strain CRL 75-36-700-3 / race SCCL) TaxID=418459 RepID=E3JX34_PUCGT|nr:uncharacterized protein PGTG_02070 [Puccinia graminis f. sp. tritici CRL 75-36-700-3]EFP76609.2 hypothetical protein PGTG_02070 [Puccinia graminis f. sp. tritici CRL 75-36-700-3]